MNCKRCSTRAVNGVCPNCGWADPDASSSRIGTKSKKTAPRAGGAAAAAPTPVTEDEGEMDLVEIEPIGEGPEKALLPQPPAASGYRTQKLDPADLVILLAEEPELLETGLSPYHDESGQRVGAGYPTEVGLIDLLARDASGDLVVVVVGQKPETLLDFVLQRLGWVRENLAKQGESVRAIVLLQEGDASLRYGAAALAGMVSFKTWQIAIRIDDIDL